MEHLIVIPLDIWRLENTEREIWYISGYSWRDQNSKGFLFFKGIPRPVNGGNRNQTILRKICSTLWLLTVTECMVLATASMNTVSGTQMMSDGCLEPMIKVMFSFKVCRSRSSCHLCLKNMSRVYTMFTFDEYDDNNILTNILYTDSMWRFWNLNVSATNTLR